MKRWYGSRHDPPYVIFTSPLIHPTWMDRYTLNKGHGGPQSWTHIWKNRATFCPPHNRSQLLHLVTTLTALSHLLSILQPHLTLWRLTNISSSFLGGSTEELKKMLDLNVLALSICTIQAFQSMKERGVDDGHIININRLDSLSTLSFVLSIT